MILLIDNYDSFTYNLYQMIPANYDVKIVRNDKISVEEMKLLNIEGIILSPGPGHPKDAGNMIDIIMYFYDKVPMLGICLGHQAMAYALGGSVDFAKNIRHGKQSLCTNEGKGILAEINKELTVMRYHSLSVKELPVEFEVLSYAKDDQEIMVMQHKNLPVIGIQYHPESIGTTEGKEIMNQFLHLCKGKEVETYVS